MNHDKYTCSCCNKNNIKLWRKSHTFANNIKLLCFECGKENQADWIRDYSPVDLEESDQLGRLIPAVPTEDGDNFWGYTSVPPEGCTWWHNLSLI